jgi:hypothetical protein
MPEIGFGDNVRVHRTPETEALGVAGHVGQVYGHTTPSITGIRVVGGSDGDYALNVHFDGSEDTIWFAPQLLDFVDHAPGTEIRVGEVSAVRGADGSWVPASDKASPPENTQRKPWWRFW